jgi:hypothetical protein
VEGGLNFLLACKHCYKVDCLAGADTVGSTVNATIIKRLVSRFALQYSSKARTPIKLAPPGKKNLIQGRNSAIAPPAYLTAMVVFTILACQVFLVRGCSAKFPILADVPGSDEIRSDYYKLFSLATNYTLAFCAWIGRLAAFPYT